MDLTIKFMNGRTLPLTVDLNTTVGQLKDLIHQNGEVASTRQRLTWQNGNRVDLSDDQKTLRQYGLSSGSTIIVLVTAPANIQVFLKTEKGLTHTYDVAPGESVSQFKSKVYNKEKVPVDQQRLIHEGKQMEDFRKLDDYGIRNGSTIFLTLRLRGGNGH